MTERKFTPPTSFPAEYVNGYGARVTLLAKGTGPFPYCGQLENGIWAFFTEDGFADDWSSYPTHDLHDIPKTNVQWANDYEEIFGCTWHDSREEADANAMWDCIAVIRREWTEGQPPEYFTEEARMSNDLVKRLRHPVGGMRPTISDGRAAADRIEELEAKLAKAVEAAEKAVGHIERIPPRIATARVELCDAIAELKGQDDE